ncbi:hypothetical protein CH35J_002059 [Colletotrichum higginsianum]|uniref:Uncharacterized protein n=1 Tax=Colletotrichum higginsianum TaxID=80884 RepID=A0A4T0WEC5_9PEZI|nr:hypothetical protein CH35J_002059 [Colletotrichum higginsianum]
MKFTLTALVAIIGVASAISVDAGLVKRQCIANGGEQLPPFPFHFSFSFPYPRSSTCYISLLNWMMLTAPNSTDFCFTSIADTKKPCCGGLVCRNKPAPNTNICEPEESPKVPQPRSEVVEKSEIPPAPQAQALPRAMPQIPRDEPIWG